MPAVTWLTSMKVTSDPSAVYTSENSRPMYPEPMMAIQSGTHSSFSAWSLVNTWQVRMKSILVLEGVI